MPKPTNRQIFNLLYGGVPLPEHVIKPKAPSKPKKPKAIVPSEHSEQCAFHQWLQWRNIPHFAVPNQNTASFYDNGVACSIANKKKAEGVSRGVPDLVIFMPKVQLYIELKAIKGGVVSEEQSEWIDVINSYPYCQGFVAHGCDEAIAIAEQFIKG
jgi:hypothetical protein